MTKGHFWLGSNALSSRPTLSSGLYLEEGMESMHKSHWNSLVHAPSSLDQLIHTLPFFPEWNV